MRRWAGVDVGGERKGFHVAVIEKPRRGGPRLCALAQVKRPNASATVAELLEALNPEVVAVDSPQTTASKGARERPCETALRTPAVCGIRGTPHISIVKKPNPTDHYRWILEGLALYAQLGKIRKWQIIECFPTASWTRLGGTRSASGLSRASWTTSVLSQLGVRDIPTASNLDERDAIVAAYTAMLHRCGGTDDGFLPIVIPR